ncbi:lipocalin family protein [Aureivirga sp. CE67]|uniref:lipocalin family protein n=1 Tax=Aureivirga sp. CE67 TaxID=1788983 RepID=UPI0018C95D94|nr:lipocalin family protein [Aureivirga sp. CE67]
MKNLFKLLVLIILFTGCSSDDDSNEILDTPPPFSIINTWVVDSQVDGGEEIALNDCNSKYSMEVRGDNTCTVNRYLKNGEGDCINYTSELKWKQNNDGQFHFESDDGYFHAEGILIEDVLFVILFYENEFRRYKMVLN